MYCKKMLLAVKKCSTNQICRLSTARIRYTVSERRADNFHPKRKEGNHADKR